MSSAAQHWAIEQARNRTDLTCTEKLLLILLGDQANNEGSCFPARRSLASVLGCSERHVSSLGSSLETKGLLRRESRLSEARQTSNWYHLNLKGGGTGVQGGGGTGVQANESPQKESSSVGASSHRRSKTQGETERLDAPTARARAFSFAGFYVDEAQAAHWKPTRKLISRVGMEAKQLAADGKPQDVICAAITFIARTRRTPAALPFLVGDIESGNTPGSNGRRDIFAGVREFYEEIVQANGRNAP